MKKNNIITVYEGIDEEKYLQKTKTILVNEKVKLLIVGGLSKRKGQDQLIRACHKLKQSGVNLYLKIVGKSTSDDSYEKSLRRLIIEYKMDDCVEFCGYSTHTQKYYSWADISFTCSDMESFGRVTVEAMMAGCLAIGSNTSGAGEIIRNGINGLLYERDNVDDLVDRIQWAISNKQQAREIAEYGRVFASTNYTSSRNADEINALYKRL